MPKAAPQTKNGRSAHTLCDTQLFYRTLKYNKNLPFVQSLTAMVIPSSGARILFLIKYLFKLSWLMLEVAPISNLHQRKDCI
jgi:hypothetical protein